MLEPKRPTNIKIVLDILLHAPRTRDVKKIILRTSSYLSTHSQSIAQVDIDCGIPDSLCATVTLLEIT